MKRSFFQCVSALYMLLARSTAAEEHSLQFAAVLSLTGAASVQGEALKDGIEFAKKELETAGWKIQIKYDDDGTMPKRTITAIEQLSSAGTKFFIGPTWSFLADAAAPIFSRTKSISLQPCNSAEFVRSGGGRQFFFLTPVRKQEALLRDWLKDNKAKRVGIIVATSTWGDLHREIFRQAAEKAGAEIVLDESFQYGDENSVIPTLVTKLRGHRPDVLLTTTSKEISILLLSNLERQKVRTTIISRDLFDAVAARLVPAEHATVLGLSIAPKRSAEFARAFQSWSGRAPVSYTENAYDTVITLSKAIDAAGDDPEKVKEYLESKFDHLGASGRIKFDAEHNVVGNDYEITEVIKRKE